MVDAMTECIRILDGRGVIRTEQREVLRLPAGDPDHGWPTRAVADGVAAATERVSLVLAGLAGRGLVSVALAAPAEDADRLDERLDLGALQTPRTTLVRDRARVTEALLRGSEAELREPAHGASAWRWI